MVIKLTRREGQSRFLQFFASGQQKNQVAAANVVLTCKTSSRHEVFADLVINKSTSVRWRNVHSFQINVSCEKGFFSSSRHFRLVHVKEFQFHASHNHTIIFKHVKNLLLVLLRSISMIFNHRPKMFNERRIQEWNSKNVSD